MKDTKRRALIHSGLLNKVYYTLNELVYGNRKDTGDGESSEMNN